MTDNEAIWRRIEIMVGDIQHHETRIALVEQRAETIKAESVKIAEETKEQTKLFHKQNETVSALKTDLRVLMVKFGCMMVVLTTLIEIGIRVAELWIKKP